MPQTSDGADAPTAVNEASLGKPATETEQICKNSEVYCSNYCTEHKNQDAPGIGPSKDSVSASKAIENPSDQTSQDALVACACSTSKEQMGVNPEGSCNELIDHDVPPSGVSISETKGIKNPSDPQVRTPQ